ncbi:MAG: putative vesicle-associated membrane protein [Streblomastix strix]|uniref:Putative vesicle-associated membrane protein n=1 Tax=Streblomastix strix TaxID=222440 RepID=A0A5J4VWP3_9EUKA|nr:MAG: putative vesicle-associated membrane protein [Streblomastix strix]
MASGIVYSCVAKGASILSDGSTVDGNFQTIARKILLKVGSIDGKASYVYDNFVFHYCNIKNQMMTYLCVADQNFDRKTVFMFLNDVQRRYEFEIKGGAYQSSNFGFQLVKLMKDYSSQQIDRIARAQNDVTELKSVVEQNIEKILDRGEKIDLLVSKSDELNQASIAFKTKSGKLRRQMWWKNIKLWLLLIAVVLVIIFFIVMISCHWFRDEKCRSKKQPDPPTSNNSHPIIQSLIRFMDIATFFS